MPQIATLRGPGASRNGAARASPLAAERARVHQEVLDFLAESPELEFPLDDLYAYQTAKPKRSRAALTAALAALVAEGRVVISDVEDGVTYWRAAP